jgi:putative tricarboxylic transport membrane protein
VKVAMQATGRSVLFAVLFCAALYLFTLTRQFEFPRAPGRLGPDVWPQAILLFLMIACVMGIGRDILAKRRPEPSPPRQDEPNVLPGDTLSPPPSAALGYALVSGGFLLLLVYPVALEYLGFPVATLLFMMLFMLVGRWRNPLGLVAVSVIGTLALFYIFRGLVYVSLPLGTGIFHSATVWIAWLLGMR